MSQDLAFAYAEFKSLEKTLNETIIKFVPQRLDQEG